MANDFQLDFIANAQKLDSSIKSVMQSKTYKVKVEADGKQVQSLTSSTEKFADAQGRAIQVNTKFDKSGKATSSTIKDITKNSNSASNSINKMTKETKSFGSDFISTMSKVTKFFLITKIIQTFTQAISEAYTTVKEFDDAVTEFSKVSNYSREAIQVYSDTLGNLGESVYRTKTEMLDAATSFKKSGFTEEDSATLSRVAALYQNIADEELSAADASEVIISQMKAFNLGAEDAEHIVDAINIVSNEFAVSSSDIGKGLTAAGAALSTYGNDFEEVIGLK